MSDYKKLMSMSKNELEEALKKLHNSESKYPEGYGFAMCYARVPYRMSKKRIAYKCSKCSKTDHLEFIDNDTDSNIIMDYKELADSFLELGYDVKIQHFCQLCIDESKGKLSKLMFLFKAEGMINYTYSKLDDKTYGDYLIALKFLQGKFSYDEINEFLNEYLMSTKTPKEINKIIYNITGIKPSGE